MRGAGWVVFSPIWIPFMLMFIFPGITIVMSVAMAG
jgi:hypothetical protein